MAEANSRKVLLPNFVMEILRERTDKHHPCTQQYILGVLVEEYGITIQRQALSRTINTMLGEDLHIFGGGKYGYYYDRYGYMPQE